MADFKQNYFQRRTKDRGPRSNNRISSPDVQVIASDGENLGVMNTNEAISMAKNQGLDLIEIAPNANPPVCKIMDMGKYKYDAQKKANLAKKKQKIVSLKEIKMRPVTETHDYEFKVKNAKKFIAKGNINALATLPPVTPFTSFASSIKLSMSDNSFISCAHVKLLSAGFTALTTVGLAQPDEIKRMPEIKMIEINLFILNPLYMFK